MNKMNKYDNKHLITQRDILNDLKTLGVHEGQNLMVHSSMSQIGWVLGGPTTIVDSLIKTLGSSGTLVMPSATPNCADPTLWEGPPVPEHWIEMIREHIPVFDKNITPTSMGAIAECFRNWPGTRRSDHPLSSVSAFGPNAELLTCEHALEFSEGTNTPYEKVYDLNFDVLLLGVGFNRCTMLHFAESLVPNRRTTTNRFPVKSNNRIIWKEVKDLANDNNSLFPKIGDEFLKSNKNIITGTIGGAGCTLFRVSELVEFARAFFSNHL